MPEASGAAAGLRADNLELWRGERCLFHGLSFELHGGEVIHVAGPNGAGKTSLLRSLAGLTLLETGRVLWRGEDIRRDPVAFHQDLAFLGHRDGLKAELSARDNLRALTGLRHALPAAACRDALAEVGLADAVDLPVRVLSAGQRRRVAIARALLSRAPLWILDEPFANLDAAGREWGHERVAAHAGQGGLVLLTTHLDLRLAAAVREVRLG